VKIRGIHLKLFLIYFLLSFIVATSTYAQNLTIIHADGSIRSNLKTEIFKQSIRFISINDFANLFNAHIYFNVQNKKVTVTLGEKTIQVTAFNPFFQIDNVIFQLPLATEYKDEKIYLPLSYFLEIIGKTFPSQIVYNKNNDILEILDPLYGTAINVSSIQVEEKTNGTLIKIITTKNFDVSDLSLRARHRWLYLDVYGGKVDSSQLYTEFKNSIIARVVPSQLSNELAQLSFRLNEEIIEKHIFLSNPKEILLSIKTKRDLSKEIKQTLESEKKKWLIDKIVIDPGHGGKDPGATGKNGTYEKHVVLSIAKYLKQLVEENTNIEVLMTRDRDKFVELNKRTEFANKNQAKLFISIHANANPSRYVKGVSTYFLGPERTDEARDAAFLENSVIKYESGSKYADLSGENFILSAMAQNVYNTESQDFAVMAQQEIIRECGLPDAGVRQAGFFVLVGASMPHIYVETAFISNPKEERLLKDESFQKKLARGIFRSIQRFKEKYELEL